MEIKDQLIVDKPFTGRNRPFGISGILRLKNAESSVEVIIDAFMPLRCKPPMNKIFVLLGSECIRSRIEWKLLSGFQFRKSPRATNFAKSIQGTLQTAQIPIKIGLTATL